MDSKTFWNHVTIKANQVASTHAEQLHKTRQTGDKSCLNGQPEESGYVFIASLEIPEIQKGGTVCPANYRLAGQRLVERSHEIASAAQIAMYLERAEENKRQIEELSARAEKRVAITLATAAPPRRRT